MCSYCANRSTQKECIPLLGTERIVDQIFYVNDSYLLPYLNNINVAIIENSKFNRIATMDNINGIKARKYVRNSFATWRFYKFLKSKLILTYNSNLEVFTPFSVRRGSTIKIFVIWRSVFIWTVWKFWRYIEFPRYPFFIHVYGKNLKNRKWNFLIFIEKV